MKNYGRKKLRDMTARLRQTLEGYFKKCGAKDAGDQAWYWAFKLGLEASMRVRQINGSAPAFLMNDKSVEQIDEAVLRECRSLFCANEVAGAFVFTNAMGWLYQYWRDDERKTISAKIGIDKFAKITAAEVIPITQIYTEPYMVDFLLQNSLVPLWRRMHPASNIVAGLPFYVKRVDGPSIKEKPIERITVLDPACGCGNFLLGAFDLLYLMYTETGGYNAEEACESIISNNLFGIDIDAKALEVTRAVLWLRAKETAPGFFETAQFGFERHIIAADEYMLAGTGELGSLLRVESPINSLAELLVNKYDVVATNPPYIDKRNYPIMIREYLRRHYSVGAGNLYAAFIIRCQELAEHYVAMITPQTFLFIKSYSQLRKDMFQCGTIRTLGHLGLGAFREVSVDTAMFVLALNDDQPGVYFRLVGVQDKANGLLKSIHGHNKDEKSDGVFIRSQRQITLLAGSPVVYWLGNGVLRMIRESCQLKDYADIVLGMKTSDNKRFVRYWWELPGCERRNFSNWLPYEKEASGYRFKRNSAHIILWNDFAQDYYRRHYSAQLPNRKYWLRPGIVYGQISSKAFTAKLLPSGHMTDMAASCVFPHKDEDVWIILALLNSKIYQWILKAFNPTLNYQPADLQRLPVHGFEQEINRILRKLAVIASEASGRLHEMEITDRECGFDLTQFFPLAEKMTDQFSEAWLAALRYILATDAIDVKLAESLNLPKSENQDIFSEVGYIACQHPVIFDYEPKVIEDISMPRPHRMLVEAKEIVAIKHRLKEIYEAGPDKEMIYFVTMLEEMAHKLRIHPISIYTLVIDSLACEGWRSRMIEKRFAEDAITRVVLETIASSAFIPLTTMGEDKIVVDFVREYIGAVCELPMLEAQFEAFVGVSLEVWLANNFFKRHIIQFRKRPIVWQLASRPMYGKPAFSCFVNAYDANCLPEVRLCVQKQIKYLKKTYQVSELEDFIFRLDNVIIQQVRPSYGVRLNIAPFEKAGLLAAPVLGSVDVARAMEDYYKWQNTFESSN
ncbi:MAG: uncharacterized protein H6Q73_597 [Firmicutes bacterium]|nr:uncharacterized protein [Bacillota bacterium]